MGTVQESRHPPLDEYLFHTLFCRYPAVEAVFLFGSEGAQRTHAESDLDLAVLPTDTSDLPPRLDILEDLARAGFCDVDLVFLKEDDIVLRFEAVKHCRLLYAIGSFDFGSFFSKTVRQYFDFLPYLKVQREVYKRSILSGQC